MMIINIAILFHKSSMILENNYILLIDVKDLFHDTDHKIIYKSFHVYLLRNIS